MANVYTHGHDWLYERVKDMSWYDRHEYMGSVAEMLPPRQWLPLYSRTLKKLSPCQTLYGSSPGRAPPPVIKLHDKRRGGRQLTLVEAFAMARQH